MYCGSLRYFSFVCIYNRLSIIQTSDTSNRILGSPQVWRDPAVHLQSSEVYLKALCIDIANVWSHTWCTVWIYNSKLSWTWPVCSFFYCKRCKGTIHFVSAPLKLLYTSIAIELLLRLYCCFVRLLYFVVFTCPVAVAQEVFWYISICCSFLTCICWCFFFFRRLLMPFLCWLFSCSVFIGFRVFYVVIYCFCCCS